jgi:hypothetical protein
MYVYLIGYSDKFVHTHVGTTLNFSRRLSEHNKVPRSCVWFPIMVLDISDPAAAEATARTWRRSSTNADALIMRGFQFIRQLCLTAYVSDIPLGLLKHMPLGSIKMLGVDFWSRVDPL